MLCKHCGFSEMSGICPEGKKLLKENNKNEKNTLCFKIISKRVTLQLCFNIPSI